MSNKARFELLLLSLVGLAVAGCAQKVTVTQYPEFWSPDMKVDSIAVWPFRNQTRDKSAGNSMADRLAAALSANGTYKVYNPSDLQAIEGQADLNIAGGNVEQAANAARKFGKVQAIITGAVTSCKSTTSQQRRFNQVARYAYDRNGNQYITGYDQVPYTYTRHDATVECTATLIRLDGSVIQSKTESRSCSSQGENPKMSESECLASAAGAVVDAFVEDFAIVQKVIQVRPNALRTSSEYYDGKWTACSSFPASGEAMFVVVTLPKEADRNRFRIVVVPKDQRKEVVAQDILWDKKDCNGCGYRFSPKEIATTGGGPGKYTVKFYSGPAPVLMCDFNITNK